MNINRSQLFWASCLAMLVTSLSFGIRAGILNRLGTDFQLTTAQLSAITATAFWGFPLTIVVGGFIVDVIDLTCPCEEFGGTQSLKGNTRDSWPIVLTVAFRGLLLYIKKHKTGKTPSKN